jgi:hypothetical protein
VAPVRAPLRSLRSTDDGSPCKGPVAEFALTLPADCRLITTYSLAIPSTFEFPDNPPWRPLQGVSAAPGQSNSDPLRPADPPNWVVHVKPVEVMVRHLSSADPACHGEQVR